MISVTDAKKIVQHAALPLPPVMLSLTDAAGFVLAQDIFAPTDLPHFNQSAMDGYALCWNDLSQTNQFQVCGEVAAGSSNPVALKEGTAMRIFTGAPLPQGSDVVVMQEKATLSSGSITVVDGQLHRGRNVRPKGSVLQKGQLVLPKGTSLSPGAIGLIASLGIARVPVFPAPKVTLLITGNELVLPGNNLGYGQVHEANSFALLAALKKIEVHDVTVKFVPDNLTEVQHALEMALPNSDIVLITGGVSLGKYDYVVTAAANVGVYCHFHKVAQKPGKPLYFGTGQGKPVFGLPGNPGAVLTCFYLYVAPAIKIMMQQQAAQNTRTMLLGTAVHKRAELTCFLKGRTIGNRVVPLGMGDALHQSSFAFADCLIELEAGAEVVEMETMVPVHYL